MKLPPGRGDGLIGWRVKRTGADICWHAESTLPLHVYAYTYCICKCMCVHYWTYQGGAGSTRQHCNNTTGKSTALLTRPVHPHAPAPRISLILLETSVEVELCGAKHQLSTDRQNLQVIYVQRIDFWFIVTQLGTNGAACPLKNLIQFLWSAAAAARI